MKYWETVYNGHTIRVENSWNSERLIVNGELQDELMGLKTNSRLYGRVKNEKDEIEIIKVSVGAYWFSLKCRVFIDDRHIYSGE